MSRNERTWHSADPLSDVLEAVHLRGRSVRRIAGESGPLTLTGRAMYIVEQGTVALRSAHGQITLEAGDFALLCHDDLHEIQLVHATRCLRGVFEVDAQAAGRLLKALPGLVTVSGSIAADRRWLPEAAGLLTFEIDAPSPGGRVMISRILDLLFIQALRAWASSEAATPGWLTAAADPHIGRALAAMHADPGRPWQVPDLAFLASLSRSAFAERFAALIGCAPGAYLAEVRLTRAAALLGDPTITISHVATTSGYTSETAFSRAFRRYHGVSPSQWREETADGGR